MRLLPKSIHRCRRYPTKFNSGRDIPLAGGRSRSLMQCDAQAERRALASGSRARSSNLRPRPGSTGRQPGASCYGRAAHQGMRATTTLRRGKAPLRTSPNDVSKARLWQSKRARAYSGEVSFVPRVGRIRRAYQYPDHYGHRALKGRREDSGRLDCSRLWIRPCSSLRPLEALPGHP